MSFKKTLMQINLAVVLGLSGGLAQADWTTCTPSSEGKTLTCPNAKDNPNDLSGYENIIIDTGSNQMGSLPSGYGIYANGSTWNINNINIKTQTMQSDAIRTDGGANINIVGKLVIHTTGYSADGINASETSTAKVKIGNDAEIYTRSGTAVRVNLSKISGTANSVEIGDNLIVETTGYGSNGGDSLGYGIYAGNRNTNAALLNGNAKAVIGNNSQITTNGANAHAVYANRGGVIQLGSTNITTNNINAYGLYAQTNTVGSLNENKGGIVDLLGDTKITVPTGGYAAYSDGEDSVITSKNAGKFTVTGDMRVNNEGKIDLRMTDNSFFTGNTFITGTGGTLNLDIAGANSQWQMSANSQLSTLTLNSGANVYLGDQSTPVNSANQLVLTMQNLNGNNGVFHIRSDIVQSANKDSIDISDLIKVTDSSSGNHKIMVTDHNTGGAPVVGDEVLHVAEIADGGAKFTLANTDAYVDMGAYKYELVEEAPLTRANDKHWYLRAQQLKGVGGSTGTKPALTNTADRSVNILNINYLLNHVETQTLLQRMGELRQTDGAQSNVWARAYTGQLDSFAGDALEGFDLDYSGVQIGADKHIDMGNSTLYLGGVVGTAKADAAYKVGDGDTESYHAGLYASYKTANGFYIDGIAKYVHMKNSFNTKTGGGNPVKGEGDTNGYSVGVEAGQRFYLNTPKTGWYVEPQAQLTYAYQNSTTIESSNTLKSELDSFNSILGRVSVIVGYTVAEGANPVDVYFKTGYVKEFDGKTGYTFNNMERSSYKLNGNWWDNGIGVNTQINKNHNVYLEADYAIGNKFDRKQLNLGYRYSF